MFKKGLPINVGTTSAICWLQAAHSGFGLLPGHKNTKQNRELNGEKLSDHVLKYSNENSVRLSPVGAWGKIQFPLIIFRRLTVIELRRQRTITLHQAEIYAVQLPIKKPEKTIHAFL